MERLLDLKQPPTVGVTYLVPCVQVKETHVAVLHPNLHAEPELGVHRPHCHVDYRFLSDYDLSFLNFRAEDIWSGKSIPALAWSSDRMGEVVEHPKECLRLFGSRRAFTNFQVGEDGQYASLEDKLAGCKLDSACRVCPHKGVNLDTVEVIGGRIVCPAHGLTFDAATGELIRKSARLA